MNAAFRLSGPAFRPLSIELDGGVLRHVSPTSAAGRHDLVVADGGRMHFFVHLVEEDGGRIGLWDGVYLGDAIRQAERARMEFGIDAPVRDLFGGAP